MKRINLLTEYFNLRIPDMNLETIKLGMSNEQLINSQFIIKYI